MQCSKHYNTAICHLLAHTAFLYRSSVDTTVMACSLCHTVKFSAALSHCVTQTSVRIYYGL